MAENASSGAAKTPAKTQNKSPKGQQAQGGARQQQKKKQAAARQQAQVERVNTILWVIPLISVLLLLWMIVVNMGIYDFSETTGLNNEQWFMLTVFIIILLFIVMILSVIGTVLGEPQRPAPASAGRPKPAADRGVVIEAVPETAEVQADAAVDMEPAETAKAAPAEKPKEIAMEVETIVEVKDIEKEKKAEKAKEAAPDETAGNILEYPEDVTGGLYGDTYIKVDKKRILKLRTLIVEDYYLM
jgi:hypothetical protein